MSDLQNYLRTNVNTLDELCNSIFVKCSRHSKYNDLVMFKYTNIAVNFDNIYTRQSRGIILDESNNWEIISYPYDKFFNLGESKASKINWETTKFYEKLDGCLMILYYYDNQWLVSSSGKPDACGRTRDPNMNLGQVFWEVWNNKNYILPLETRNCYIFELMTQKNPVNIKYESDDLVFHGARNLDTLKEIQVEDISPLYNWSIIEKHELNRDPEEIVSWVNKRAGTKHEGLILCDADFNRVKVKSKEYVALAYSISMFQKNSEKCKEKVYELLLNENHDDINELCNSFPKLKETFLEIKTLIERLILEIEVTYENVKHIELQRDFAIEVSKSKVKGFLFMLRNNKANSARECLKKSNYVTVKGF